MTALALLACDWGRAIWAAEDTAPCHAQAVQRIAIHVGDEPALLQFCGRHRDLVLRETDPHQPTTSIEESPR